MKRLFSLLTAFALAAALCAPVMADDVTTPDVTAPTPTPTASIDTTNSDGVYVSAYSVTDTAGGEVTTVQVGDKINIVLKVVDHASARYCVKPEEISARINSAVFTYTGTGEIGQLFDSNDDPNATRLQNVRNGSASPEEVAANAQYNYYSYVILFRDVIYNGGGNTLAHQPFLSGHRQAAAAVQRHAGPVRGQGPDDLAQPACAHLQLRRQRHRRAGVRPLPRPLRHRRQ